MSLKKKILIVGPISDFGGREVMTNLLARSLTSHYAIQIVSTIAMSKNSVAIKGFSYNWDTINYNLYRAYLFLKISALLTKLIYYRKEPAYDFINNKLSKKYFKFEKKYYKSIEEFVNQSSCVIYSGEIDGKWLKEIIQICKHFRKPVILRVTGEIKQIPKFLETDTSKLHILAHSISNATKLKPLSATIWHIDQTTVLEQSLLELKIEEDSEIIYGFLGRFSSEKGILELMELFSKTGKKLKIAGNGPLLKDVVSYSKSFSNIDYEGQLSPDEITRFYKGIDVLVISSYEEGGPIVGIEAMAAGRLLVSTRVGAMEERLMGTDNDFWFDISKEDSLKVICDKLESLTPYDRKDIKVRLRKKYIKSNSLSIIEEKYLNIFKEILTE